MAASEVPVMPKSVRLIRPMVGDGCERHYVYDPLQENEASGLAVTLRPVVGDDAANYMDGDPTTQLTRAAALWAKHGVGWNLGDPRSDPKNPTAADITAANFLLLLPYPAQLWVANVMLGFGMTAVPADRAGEPPTTEQEKTEGN